MIDLHLHLDGSLRIEDVIEFASLSNVELPNLEALPSLLMVDQDCQDLGDYLKTFDLPLQVLQTKETIEKAVNSLIRRLKEQGLIYAEIRFAPQLHCQRGLTQREVLEAAIRGLDGSFDAQLILCCMRGDKNHDANMETIRLAHEYLNKGVCAIDLAGNESAFPTKMFKELFDGSLPTTLHAGESVGAFSIDAALDLHANRIGHGLHAIQDEKVIERLVQNQVALEMCYTSNLQTKAASDLSVYPLKELLDKNVLVTINTDNMTVSNTTLKQEYKRLMDVLDLSSNDCKKIAENAAQASFTNEDKKRYLVNYIEDNFEAWLNRE